MPENCPDYQNLFETKVPFVPTGRELDALAEYMTSKDTQSGSSIPAGYTYLGQFISHEVSLDSAENSRIDPWLPNEPRPSTNLREPFIDLELIYGQEVPANNHTPSRRDLLETRSQTRLRLGVAVPNPNVPDELQVRFPNDLLRCLINGTAQIIDHRNDENLVLSQMQVAFIKFHNAIVADLGGADTKKVFNEARRLAIRHYQWIVLHDYLKTIVKKSVWDEAMTLPAQNYKPEASRPFIPLEFSVAAFRTGHSMIRNKYNWNRFQKNEPGNLAAPLDLLLGTFTGRGMMTKLPTDWMINWKWFFDIDGSVASEQFFNFALKMDTSISSILGRIRDPTSIGYVRENSLAALDLFRGKFVGLPSGQLLAKYIGTRVLEPNELLEKLPPNGCDSFAEATPLWFYLLAEAELEEAGERLGELGSRIVAETLVQLVRCSEFSILNDDLSKSPEFLGNRTGGKFGMAEMLKFIAYKNLEYDEIDPTEIGIQPLRTTLGNLN